MRFRPCIDIHNGKVKQIIGSTLKDEGDTAEENFVSGKDASYYAEIYQKHQLEGGHIIMLNAKDSPYYVATRAQAAAALETYRKGMQIGGGITDVNALEWIAAGASHVIVTSFVFQNGSINYGNLEKLCDIVGKERLVLDLSCRRKGAGYYVVTDRWQKFTDMEVNFRNLDRLSAYCDEFLIHAVDVEGKSAGLEERLAELLGSWGKIPVTYAGGIRSFEDVEKLEKIGKSKLDFTVGSALDIFGGNLSFIEMSKYAK